MHPATREEERDWLADFVEDSEQFIALTDPEGKLLYVNAAGRRLAGIEAEGPLPDAKVADLLVPREGPAALRGPDGRVRGHLAGEAVLRGRKGAEIPVVFSAFPLRARRPGEAEGMGFVAHDIRPLKKAEAESIRERDFNRSLIESFPAFIVAADAEGRVTHMNTPMLESLGYEREEILGRDYIATCIPERERAAVSQLLGALRDGDEVFSYRNHVVARDGRELLVEWNGRSVDGPDGAGDHVFGVGIDITDRVRSEEELYQAAKLISLGTLVSGMAHEVNNPNNFIRLNAHNLKTLWEKMEGLLERCVPGGLGDVAPGIPYAAARGMIRELLDGIIAGSRRIERLVTDLKEFSRAERGALDQTVDLNSVVACSLVMVEGLIRKSTDHFSVDYSPTAPEIMGNDTQLEQVVVNLVTNACQALENRSQGISVAVSRSPDGEAVVLSVEDEGVGIPAEDLPRVMDPFFTTRRAAGGSGLGLFVSYRIIEAHGGSVRFDAARSRGVRVEVSLPARGAGARGEGRDARTSTPS
jgi:PAS domain S-box-containing protein